MEMTSDTKFVIGVLVATVLVIGGGAYFSSKKTPDAEGRLISESLQNRLMTENSPTVGPQDAKVTVVEFADFQCPSCASVHPLLKEVKNKYKDQSVRFVFRHYPLPQHEHAFLAAEAATEAAKQNKFWEFHDLLFENQKNIAKEHLLAYAEKIGLDKDTFEQALNDHTHKDIVEKDKTDGAALGVQGTPTFIINNRVYNGKYTMDAISAAIDSGLTSN